MSSLAPSSTDAPAVDAWHPVALSRELRPGGWLQVRLLGRTWALNRGTDGVLTAPAAADVGERYGLVWLAPTEPRRPPLEVPEIGDRRYVVGSLAPVRAPGPAAPLVEVLVAAAPPPVVHTSSALCRRGPGPSGRGSTTVVVLLQPEDAESTRIYGCVLLSAGPGRPLPSPATLAAAVAAEQRALEDVTRRRVRG